MIATYSDDNVVDVMNMAWGGICAENMVSLNIDEDHKTSENIKKRGAFTLSIADIPHIEAADFFGIASGSKMPDKFERSGLSAVKSEKVDAPIVQEFPLTLECRVIEDKMEVYGHHIIGKIVGVLADEAVLNEKGGRRKAECICVRPVPQRLLCHRRKGRSGMAHRCTADEKTKIIPALAGKLPARYADLAFQDTTRRMPGRFTPTMKR